MVGDFSTFLSVIDRKKKKKPVIKDYRKPAKYYQPIWPK